MKDFADLRQLLVAYRLGELSPEDRERLDDLIIGDQDFSDRMAEAAYDLLDDYRAGRTASTELRRLEKAFSESELRQGRARELDLTRAAHPASRRTLRWLPLGASLAFVSAGLLLIFLHSHNAQAPSLVASSGPSENSGPPAPSVAPVPPSKLNPRHLLAVLLLQPEVVRSGTAALLELEPSTQAVEVQWVVPDGVTARGLTLSITRNGSILKTIAQRGSLQEIGGNLVAEFNFPPGIFARFPVGTRFLFIVNSSDASHTSLGEYPVIVRARP